MLERPDLQDDQLAACLQHEYGLRVSQIAFLPLGADRDTAVYRVVADDATPYFLRDQGIAQIIAPLSTKSGQLWANLGTFKTILYPFVEGRNGYEIELADRHWIEFGTALKRIQTAALPPALVGRLEQESYAPKWREIVRTFLKRAEADRFGDPVAVELAAFMRAKRDAIADLVGRAERFAQVLQARSPALVLCHSDIHAGNVLIGVDDAFYIVDWDNPILAPKARDLMFIGGGQGFTGHTSQEEEALFYRGYGETQIDPVALAYYRYERIVTDIAVYCEQLFLSDAGGEDRAQSLQYLKSIFRPGGTLEIAYNSDRTQTVR